MKIEVSAKQLSILAALRDSLADPHRNWGRLPDVLPTGEEIKTVGEVAAMMNCDQETAAIAILQSKDAGEHLVMEAKDVYALSGGSTSVRSVGTRRERRERLIERVGAIRAGERYRKRRRRRRASYDLAPNHTETRFQLKGLHGQSEDDFEGIAIMLKVEAFTPWPGGVKKEDLHITLAYYGKVDDYTGDLTEQDFIERLRKYAETEETLMPMVAGITRFSAFSDEPDSKPPDPIVANVSDKDVDRMHADTIDMFGEGAGIHGYTPHMTLAYVDQDDPMPVQRFNPQPVICDKIVLGWGRSRTEIPLLPYGSTSNTEKEEGN